MEMTHMAHEAHSDTHAHAHAHNHDHAAPAPAAPGALPELPSILVLTDKAAQMIKDTIERESLHGHGLRVGVVGGGCSGFQYSLDLDKEAKEGDFTFEVSGINVFVDPMSVHYLKGVQVDYVETAYASGFSFSNPNAKTTCGCGSSFSA